MKICSNCGNKLADTDKKCNICKTKAKNAIQITDENDKEKIDDVIASVRAKGNTQVKKKPNGCLVAIVVIIVFAIIGMLSLNGMSGGDDNKYISMDEFNQINQGMTYEEVSEIIGSEGELVSEVDIGMGEQYRTVIYTWYGDGVSGANANFTFQGDKLVSKAQIGLR